MTIESAPKEVDPIRVPIANLSVEVNSGRLTPEQAEQNVQGMCSNLSAEAQAIAIGLLRNQIQLRKFEK